MKGKVGRIILLCTLLFVVFFLFSCGDFDSARYDSLAKCLTEKWVVYYGSSIGCRMCPEQEKMFSESFQYINYIDCAKSMQQCKDDDVVAVPSWKINEEVSKGFKSAEELISLSGCSSGITCNESSILVGTECCLDKDNDAICDIEELLKIIAKDGVLQPEKDAEKGTEKVKTTIIERESIKPVSKEKYGIEDLENDINELAKMNITTKNNYRFIQDRSSPEYYNGNGVKFYVAEVLDTEVVNVEDFVSRFSSPNWQGYQHFANMTALSWLHEPLQEEHFSTEREYRDYFLYRYLVEQTVREKTYEVDEGKVLEYQLINWIFDQKGYFDGAWIDTFLIYKIYCSPNLIVYIRPGWEKLGRSMHGAKAEVVHKNWRSMMDTVRPGLLNLSNEILKNCPVERRFFNDMPKQEFESSRTLAFHYATYLRHFWNFTMNVSVETEPSKDHEKKYVLKRINVSFTSHEYFGLHGPLLLELKTLADGKKSGDTFVSEKRIATVFLGKRNVNRTFISEKKPEFSDNVTIQVLLRDDESNLVRPIAVTFDRNGTMIGREEYG